MGKVKVVQSEIEFNMWIYTDETNKVSLGRANTPLRKALLCLPYAQHMGEDEKGGFVHFKCPLDKYTSDLIIQLRKGIISIVNFSKIKRKITFQDINQVVRDCYPEFEFVVQVHSGKDSFSYLLVPTSFVSMYPTARDTAVLGAPDSKTTIKPKKGKKAGDIPLHEWLEVAANIEDYVENLLNPKKPKKKKVSGKKKIVSKKRKK